MTTETTHIQVEDYRRFAWMLFPNAISENKNQLMAAMKTLAAIEHFETTYRILISQSMTNFFDLEFPQMKRKTLHRADICKRAAIRLRTYYNNIINEIIL